MEIRSGSDVHLDEWVAPTMVDEQGYLQAGRALEWMDVGGKLVATRHCRHPVVTVSIEAMELRRPMRLGEHAAMTACVAHTSQHSIGVFVTMAPAESGTTPQTSLEAYMTFVPLDRRGRPMSVPQFSPETPAERARFAEGEMRREFRRRLKSGELTWHSGSSSAENVPEKDWPLPWREWMSRLPRYLRMPWERPDAQRRSRHRSYIHRIEPVRLSTLNFQGTLYGGTLMRWSESSASLSARAYADGAPMRCAGLHGLTFLRSVEQNRFVHIRSVVVHTAAQSLTSLVSVQSENPEQGSYFENLRAFFTYVPLDVGPRLAPIECQSDEERGLFDEVEQRLALQRRLGGKAEETVASERQRWAEFGQQQ
jgi:acyl-CoA hydrolase